MSEDCDCGDCPACNYYCWKCDAAPHEPHDELCDYYTGPDEEDDDDYGEEVGAG